MPSGLLHLHVLPCTVKAGVTVLAGHALVRATSGSSDVQLAGADANHISGVAREAAAAGEGVAVVTAGIVDVLVDDGEGALAIGDRLAPLAGGTWGKMTAAGKKYYAIALGTTTGGTGELVRVHLLGLTPAQIPAS